MKTAIVHEYLIQYGGAERVLDCIHELYPDAPVYTLIYEPDKMPDYYRKWNIIESPHLKNRFIRNHYKSFFPIYPFMIEQFDFREYDLVISSSYAYAHGIVTPPSTCHICYCHTPMRFVWVQQDQYRQNINPAIRWFYDYMIHYLRIWDSYCSQRPDYYISSCKNVSERISKYYHRESHIIHPPVDVNKFVIQGQRKDYYLLVSRLVHPYKRIDIAIECFNQLGYPLYIVGDGVDRSYFESISKPNIQFMGHQQDAELQRLYSEAKALIFPGEDDFGIAPLEANACGCPVIAYRAGGILETQIEGTTALFFNEPNAASLKECVKQFIQLDWNRDMIREHVQSYDQSIFKQSMQDFISNALENYRKEFDL